ncbi:hypothetical protein Taro_019803 [Colocasia esculenta]|uniref:Uncharacterized protein n=1 Tax=Colocasia esculenta TaxID=4460 RepID=A0A843UXS9_COLES|nr:hypothetical protein [Colocasia esculenta]
MGAVFTLPYLLLVGGASLPSNPLPRRGLPCPAWITAYNYSPSPSKSVRTFLLQKSKPSATNGHHDGLGEEDDPGRRRVGGGRAGRPASRHRLPDRRCLRHPRQWPLPRLPHLLPALQGAARGGVGSSGGVPGQHRRPRCLRVPPGRRGAAQHQPPPAGRARRPRARGGPPRQPRQDHPCVGGEAVEGGGRGGS